MASPPLRPVPPRPPHPPAVRAVLFDLDGVLIDSFDVWLAVVNSTARRFGAPEVTREGLHGIFGQGISDDMRNLYPGRTREEILAAYDEAMPACIPNVQVNPEAVATLALLRARGLRSAVVTNSQTSIAAAVLRVTGLGAHLDAWAGVGLGLREKPAPDLLIHMLERLGVAPRDALMVGDTDYDEKAARAAGTRFLRYEIRKGASLRQALAGAAGLSGATA